jgi:hypothetical protein
MYIEICIISLCPQTTGDIIVGLELIVDGPEATNNRPDPLEDNDLVSLLEKNDPTYSKTDAAILLPAAFVHAVKDSKYWLSIMH